jgi:hypothetical protein
LFLFKLVDLQPVSFIRQRMKKFLIFSLVGIIIIAVLIIVVRYVQFQEKKSLSPEEQVVYKQNDLKINVFYNRPFKKGRVIFGGLVPFNKVWRTGANEATTFETNKELSFEGKILKKGKYTLWTIPKEEMWTIIFNTEYGQWGINPEGEANRNPALDALTIEVQSLQQDEEFEQFTISFEKTGEDAEMVLLWDKTLVSVPFTFQ